MNKSRAGVCQAKIDSESLSGHKLSSVAAPPNFTPVSGEWASGGFDIPVAAAAPAPKPVEPPQPKPMAIVLPFIEREREQVSRLLALIAKLSGKPLSRTLFLVPFKGLKIDDVLAQARAAFADVQVIADSEGAASDWKKDDKVRDAAGPNSLFRQAAWFFYLHRELGSWLWLEPDCVPLAAGFDDAIEAAYRAGGKPFMGARMKFQEGEYLNGAAVYPRDAVARAPTLVTRAMWTQFPDLEIAFDVAGGLEVLRQASFTDLIELNYRSDAESSCREKSDNSKAVLLHGDRDGQLLQKLLKGGGDHGRTRGREKKNGTPHRNAGIGNRNRQGKVKAGGNPAGNGENSPVIAAPTFDPDSAAETSTVGDQIRAGVQTLVNLSTNANRKTRILAALRKTDLLPRIAR